MDKETIFKLIEGIPEQEAKRAEYYRQLLKEAIIESNEYYPELERVYN